jgi:hypothetical protein
MRPGSEPRDVAESGKRPDQQTSELGTFDDLSSRMQANLICDYCDFALSQARAETQ